MSARTCEHCSAELTRKPREKPYRFAARRFCDRTCTLAAQRALEGPPRPCGRCGRPLVRRPAGGGRPIERADNFRVRRFCGPDCFAAAKRSPNETRTCAHEDCDATFTVPLWDAQRFCSTRCARGPGAHRRRAPKVTCTCERCGAAFVGRAARPGRFCGWACYRAHRGEWCRSGRHALVGDNLGVEAGNRRYCRACRADRTPVRTAAPKPRRRAAPPPPPPPPPSTPARPVWRPNAPGWAPIPIEESA